MDCRDARNRLYLMVDGELPDTEADRLRTHLGTCPACAREMRMLLIPKQIGRMLPVLNPSPYFYERLRANLQSTERSLSFWQIMMGLSRQVVPALATVTLILLSTFAYLQVTTPQTDVRQVYDGIFTPADQQEQFVLVEQGEITDDVVLLGPAGPEADTGAGTGDSPVPR